MFLGVVFDVDHDFEGPRAPKAHLDTVNRNLLDHLRRPFIPLYMDNKAAVHKMYIDTKYYKRPKVRFRASDKII